MLNDGYDVYPARVKPKRRRRDTPGPAATYGYADHPYEVAGSGCRCGRPFEEHEEAIR